MAKIRPIRDLRDTTSISEEAHKCDEPIYITKNGLSDLVVLSDEYYSKISGRVSKGNKQDNPLGYIRISAASINISIGDVDANVERIKDKIKKASENNVHLLVLPELCITGYTCGDLFLNQDLLDNAEEGIKSIEKFSSDYDVVVVIGAPLRNGNSLYNCAVVIFKGQILGVVPKTYIPNYSEFYEKRYFASYRDENSSVFISDEEVVFGTKLIFMDSYYRNFAFSCEICEDLWAPLSPDIIHCLNGAKIIVNLSASDEIIGKADYRLSLVKMASAKLDCIYAYASCGKGESSQDLVYGGHNILAEDGRILGESRLFENEDVIGDADVEKITNSRLRNTTFENRSDNYKTVSFCLHVLKPKSLLRSVEPNPFILQGEDINKKAMLIMRMQEEGLIQRMNKIHCVKAVIGLSGGLDSTLALLSTYEAFKLNNLDVKNIYAITLPSLGTTDLTHSNAYKLACELGCSFKDININEAVKIHFRDIGHDSSSTNAAFENSQARERTQILMDFANDNNAIMVGTGDLSELCLGWTTYGGDHMSMYGINCGIPKTLVKEIVKAYADNNPICKDTLYSVLGTPITPELIPSKKGKIVQKTEDIVGPYELVDFFIYYFLRRHFTVEKIRYLALVAYKDKYTKAEVDKWLNNFLRRFFNNQFKRSCLPDGMKIGSVAVSPRGDLRLPSDASSQMFISSLERLSNE